MATPMTADQFLAALKTEGLHVVEHAGWRTHNREGHGGWGPMNGVMIHHTAGVAPSDGQIVWSGRSDLPGPLAHGYLAKDGTVTMTANGRANHAGGGSAAVLAAVVAESSPLPATHFHDGSSGAVDGNAHFYGLEISNLGNGKDPYSAEQYDAAVKWAAAICRHHGWTERSVIGHKEWSDWKSDPSFSMTVFRADVAAQLGRKPVEYAPFPGASWFRTGRRSPVVAAMHDRLVAVGCNRYKSSANKDVIGSGDEDSYEAWQRKCGYSGAAAKWPPGKTTWDKLKVPKP